jgi:hypothetical protein
MPALRSAILLSCPLLALGLGAVAGLGGSAAAQNDAPMLPPPPASAPANAPPANAPSPSAQPTTANAPPAVVAAPPTAVSGVTVVARKPTVVSGVTVVAAGWCPRPDATRYPTSHDPVVVDSSPAQNAALPPGPIFVRVSFDQAMSCDWEVSIEGGDDDPCAKAGAWALPGRRTFVTRCVLQPGTRYVFHFRKRDGYGFVGLSGRNAQPFDLAFDTTEGRPLAANAPNPDPHPQGGEPVKAYVTCLDQGRADENNACQKAWIDADGPPDTPQR